MKITIISPFSFGYINALVEELQSYPSVEVSFIQLDKFKLEYSGVPQRVKNFFSKTLLCRNIKQKYLEDQIKKEILSCPPSNYILVIRPDKLKGETLLFLKEHTKQLISYYFDAIVNIPKMKERLPYFDKVYSYEKEDVEKYDLGFITNFIPVDHYIKNKENNIVFNISSYDERFPVIEAVARQLNEQNHPYNILIRQRKGLKSKYVKMLRDYLPLSETKKMIEQAGILLDIQKCDQKGLSFRVFEALGAGKKLITTNSAVVDYDFFNPDNICVINKKKPVISKEFLNKPYVDIPESIVAKYRRRAWIKEVFGIEKKN